MRKLLLAVVIAFAEIGGYGLAAGSNLIIER
jgi:hypothetical protein